MGKMGCKACPLDKDEKDLRHPKMRASGNDRATFYLLGEAPTDAEDSEGEAFVGKSGKLIRRIIPEAIQRRNLRVHNTIRCAPPKGRAPELAEIECCRGYVVKDIEDCAPVVVIGAGNVPLNWATGLSGIAKWRGHLIATKIGNHPCWYYPILHPSAVLKKQRRHGKSEHELTFEHDLDALFELVDRDELERVHVYDAPYDTGLQLITGQSGGDIQLLEEAFHRLVTVPQIGIDLETNALRPYNVPDPCIHLVAVGTFDDTVCFPLDHPEGWNSGQRRRVEGMFLDFIIESGNKVAHNLGFEMEWLGDRYDPRILRLTGWEDTMAMAHTLDETPGVHSLDVQCREHFGFFLKAQSRVDLKNHAITDYPLLEGMRYNGLDTKWCHKLAQKLLPIIDASPSYSYEYNRKVGLAPTLVLTEQKGVPVDFDYAETMDTTLTGELASLDARIQKCPEVQRYGKQFGTFSPSAPEQVVKLMKDICKRHEVEKLDDNDKVTGYTSDEEALNKIPRSEVPSAPLILERRVVAKLKSTYIDPIISRRVVMADDRIHTRYNSMVAVTGRLSSEDPNLQNFPARKRKEIRGVIRAPDGHWLLKADYGQIEARVLGMASHDDKLVRALWTDYDIHGFWTTKLLKEYPQWADYLFGEFVEGTPDLLGGKTPEEKLIFKAGRQEMKNGWVFPLFFGSSHRSTAENLHIPEDLAQDLAAEFWDEFKGVKEWQDDLIKFYQKHLYVETLTGRRRRGAISKNQLINDPIQGTAADIVLKAMTVLSEMGMVKEDEELQPNLNIHDDLTFIVQDQTIESVMDFVATEMCRPRFDFINVPVLVEMAAGTQWHACKEVGIYRSDKLFNIRNPYA